MSTNPKVVAWYRASRPTAFIRWVSGAVMVTVGMLVGSIGRMPEWLIPQPLQWTLLGLGGLLVLAGVVTTIANAFNTLGEEAYLLLRIDALVYHPDEGDDHIIPWRSLDDIKQLDDTRHLQITVDDGGEPLTITHGFQSTTPHALVQHILDTRRRALMGLLR